MADSKTNGPRLEIAAGGRSKTVPLPADLTVGSGADATLTVRSDALKGIHARFRRRNGRVTVEQVEGPVAVNGERCKGRELRDGDAVQVGHLKVTYRAGADGRRRARNTDTPLPEELGRAAADVRREASASTPHLAVIGGPAKGERVALDPDREIVIGRGKECDVRTQDAQCSRRHAALRRTEGGRWRVRDLGSSNGTLLDGLAVERPVPVGDGAVIELGDTRILFRDPTGASAGDDGGAFEPALRVVGGPADGRTIPLTGPMVVGSGPAADINVGGDPDTRLEITLRAGRPALAAAAGDVELNGEAATAQPLALGDTLRAGAVRVSLVDRGRGGDWSLLGVEGPCEGRVYLLGREPLVLGRGAEADAPIPDERASKRHARISPGSGGEGPVLDDLKSSNGTTVNGERCSRRVLNHGDHIGIGDSVFALRNEKAAQRAWRITAAGGGTVELREPGDQLTVGAHPTCDIVVQQGRVAPRHGRFVLNGDRLVFEPLDDEAWAYRNDEPMVEPTGLSHEDTIRVGKVELVVMEAGRRARRTVKHGAPLWVKLGVPALLLGVAALALLVSGPDFSGWGGKDDRDDFGSAAEERGRGEQLNALIRRAALMEDRLAFDEAKDLLIRELPPFADLPGHERAVEIRERNRELSRLKDAVIDRLNEYMTSEGRETVRIDLDDGMGDQELVELDGERVRTWNRKFAGSTPHRDLPWEDVGPRGLLQLALAADAAQTEHWPILLDYALEHDNVDVVESVILARHQDEKVPDELAAKYVALAGIDRPDGGLCVFEGELMPVGRRDAILAEREAAADARAEAEAQRRREEAARREREQRLARERAEFEIRLEEINRFAETYDYDGAIQAFREYRETLESPDLRERVDLRIEDLMPMKGLFDRLIAGINEGTLSDPEVDFGSFTGTLTQADKETFRVSIRNGFTDERWAWQRPRDMVDMFKRIGLQRMDLFHLGVFCFETGQELEANRLFIQAMRYDDVRPEIFAYVARKLGVQVPEDGFVPYKGRLVSPEVQENLEKGLVQHRNPETGEMEWMTPEDKAKYEEGFVKRNGEWVSLDEAELIDRGMVKYTDPETGETRWISKEELAQIRSNWATAWEYETEHYWIRSNASFDFVQELGRAMEEAYKEYVNVFGREADPVRSGKHQDGRMMLYAFRTYDDYREWCIANGFQGQLRAGGFWTMATNIGVGYTRNDNMKVLLSTMVHEGAHQFYGNTFYSNTPSWYAEGTATYFEGYTWDGQAMTWDHVSHRVRGIQAAMRAGNHMPLEELVAGEAGALINADPRAAGLFYAEVWSLYWFLSTTEDEEFASRWAAYRERTDNRGNPRGPRGDVLFLEIFGDVQARLEEEWVRAVLAL